MLTNRGYVYTKDKERFFQLCIENKSWLIGLIFAVSLLLLFFLLHFLFLRSVKIIVLVSDFQYLLPSFRLIKNWTRWRIICLYKIRFLQNVIDIDNRQCPSFSNETGSLNFNDLSNYHISTFVIITSSNFFTGSKRCLTTFNKLAFWSTKLSQ